jgi:formylglycine-generating enzyme required for sulfatase activity
MALGAADAIPGGAPLRKQGAMTSASPAGCARCGTILDTHFRFCPECALPVSGDGVMSTEIAELRRRVEAASQNGRGAGWPRYVMPTFVAAMLAFVVVLGLVLFNGALLNRLLPPPGEGERAVAVPHAPRWEPHWVSIPAGTFPYGDPAEHVQGHIPYPYFISQYEVDNGLWLEYLTSEQKHIKDMRLWEESFPRNADGWKLDAEGNARLVPERRSHPVTNISPVAIAEFCEWLTKRLDNPRWQIRIPTQLEWEYAARGTDPARKYTWGNGDLTVPIPQSGGIPRTRTGIASKPVAVSDPQLAEDDTSPFGVVGMGTNVSEWTLRPQPYFRLPDQPEREHDEDLSIDQLREAIEQQRLPVAWRGASYTCDVDRAKRYATGWWKTGSEPRDCKSDVGIRLVKVKAPQ